MNSFKNETVKLPLGSVWLMNSISEHKGKQELYTKQSPQILKSLVEMALIESAESSNRIEGVAVERNRLKPLIIGRSKPHDRPEEEVAGYRRALDLIHKKHASLRITPETIKELHRLCRGEIIFKPVSSDKTPAIVEQLCLSYENSVNQLKYPEIYAVACLVLDFLCIHPFRDGNGRVSRLLTLLALYQHGYQVTKYISLERITEQSKETYYESLNKSSQKWHQSKHDIFPWFNYFLGTVLRAYKEFEERAGSIKPAKGVKTEIITAAIEKEVGEFAISDIERLCPGISRPMIRVVLENLRSKGKIEVLGTGRSAHWRKRDNKS